MKKISTQCNLCETCGASFLSKENGARFFCSLACLYLGRGANKAHTVSGQKRNGENRPCSFCGIEKWQQRARLNTHKDFFCDKECFRKWKTGRNHNNGEKISAALKGIPKSREHVEKLASILRGRKREDIRGEKHFNWTGGEQSALQIARKCARNHTWKINVLIRDARTCVLCGNKDYGNIQVDHIVPLSFLIKVNAVEPILASVEACDALFDEANGRVLCIPCHKGTDTYGERAKKYTGKYYANL